METNKVYIKTDEEKLTSLIADEAKSSKMLDELSDTVRQLRAKNSFRLALLHQLKESIKENK